MSHAEKTQVIPVLNQNCNSAGGFGHPSHTSGGDFTFYAFTESKQVWSQVRRLFRAARKERGGNGAYMRRVARTLAESIEIAYYLDSIELGRADGNESTLTLEECFDLSH